MEYSDLINLVETNCINELNENGEFFFGSRKSLKEKNGVMIVGLNPGGNGLPTIKENIKKYNSNSKMNYYSAYLDQCWHDPYYSNYETCPKCLLHCKEFNIMHLTKHQKMIVQIANKLDLDLRTTPSFNAFWKQTKTANDLAVYYKNKYNIKLNDYFVKYIFPVFNNVIIKNDIKLIICLGNGIENSSFSFFLNAFGLDKTNIINITNNYRDGRYYNVRDGLVVFGIPHPSFHILSQLGLNSIKDIFDNLTIAST